MTHIPDNTEVKEFRIREPNGNVKKYKAGDVVHKDGKNYRAIRNTSGYSPEHGTKGGWQEVNKNRITKFTDNSSPPEYGADEGDEWFDNDSGILFTFISKNGIGQWVEM